MGSGVTEEDLVIILKREIADELARIGLDLGTTEKVNAFRDDLVYMRTQRVRQAKREDIIRNTLLALLITAAAYAVFQGARYYLLNGLEQGQAPVQLPAQKQTKSGVLYEHPPVKTAANGPLDRVGAPTAGSYSRAVAAATAGHPVQGRAGGDLLSARLLDRP